MQQGGRNATKNFRVFLSVLADFMKFGVVFLVIFHQIQLLTFVVNCRAFSSVFPDFMEIGIVFLVICHQIQLLTFKALIKKKR